METGVKELTEKYRKRFEAFYHTEGSNTDRKGKQEEENGRKSELSKRGHTLDT